MKIGSQKATPLTTNIDMAGYNKEILQLIPRQYGAVHLQQNSS